MANFTHAKDNAFGACDLDDSTWRDIWAGVHEISL